MSMLTLDLLTLLSQVLGKVRVGTGALDSTVAFGGVNIMLMGDFHQFPPVGNPLAALYCEPSTRNTSIVGKALYNQFQTLVILREQQRITDRVWNDILHRIRGGECTRDDLVEIRKLVLTEPDCEVPEFDHNPWDTAVLVTPRNSVRSRWNRASLKKHLSRAADVLYICDAEDTVGDERTPTNFEQKTTIAGMKLDQTKRLSHRVMFSLGMEVMVMLNLAMEADLANGSRGVIDDIVLDPREERDDLSVDNDGCVRLRYPPAMILFHPYHYEFEAFPGFEPGLIPIFPSEDHFHISYRGNSKTKIFRRQYPLCAAYAFTDHKSQGQTIKYVIVDIGRTKRFPVTPFAAYVTLSRSRGRNSIRLLRDFDDEIFTKHPSEQLRVEDQRLEDLDQRTKEGFEAGLYDFL